MADTGIKPSKTVTYKVVGKLEIPLDIYLPKDTKKAPILLWFHGGGLLYVPSPLMQSSGNLIQYRIAKVPATNWPPICAKESKSTAMPVSQQTTDWLLK
jgi:hypothetical protein